MNDDRLMESCSSIREHEIYSPILHGKEDDYIKQECEEVLRLLTKQSNLFTERGVICETSRNSILQDSNKEDKNISCIEGMWIFSSED